jgi:hypothetical protein
MSGYVYNFTSISSLHIFHKKSKLGELIKVISKIQLWLSILIASAFISLFY